MQQTRFNVGDVVVLDGMDRGIVQEVVLSPGDNHVVIKWDDGEPPSRVGMNSPSLSLVHTADL